MPPVDIAPARRQAIQTALKAFADTPLKKAAVGLLNALGYASEKTADLGNDSESFLANIEAFRPDLGAIHRDKLNTGRWNSCAFLFQLTNDEIPSLVTGQMPLGADSKVARGLIESFVMLAIELKGEEWSRSQIATISRELNRRFPMPGILLFKHGGLFSLAVIDRRQNLRDASCDVIDSRITLIKDVRCDSPHRAHVDILASLALENLGERRRPSNFRELFDACEKAGVAALSPNPSPSGRGELKAAAEELAARIFANDHPIYAMLFDLQGLDVVRIVEGRE